MRFALTTRWNSRHHSDGEALVEEILELGIDRLEVGYDLTLDLLPGLLKMVEQGAVAVQSVHNYCPVPLGAPAGHPELWTLASADSRIREFAVSHTRDTIECAARLGASAVVLHCGYVEMRAKTAALMDLAVAGKQYTDRYEKLKLKLQLAREKRASRHVEFLCRGLEQLLPTCERCGVRLGLENLPSWEAVPTELEAQRLFQRFDSKWLGYWHDLGHGQVRENLGFIGHRRWVERLAPHTIGVHIHDVSAPVSDHLMPPRGDLKFGLFKVLARMEILRVFEPAPETPAAEIQAGMDVVRAAWSEPESGAENGDR